MKGVTRVTGTRDPPLVTIDDDLVRLGVEFDRSANVGSVGTRDSLFSHGERTASLAFEEGLEPFLLLSWVSVTSEYLCARCRRRG